MAEFCKGCGAFMSDAPVAHAKCSNCDPVRVERGLATVITTPGGEEIRVLIGEAADLALGLAAAREDDAAALATVLERQTEVLAWLIKRAVAHWAATPDEIRDRLRDFEPSHIDHLMGGSR